MVVDLDEPTAEQFLLVTVSFVAGRARVRGPRLSKLRVSLGVGGLSLRVLRKGDECHQPHFC